MTLVIAHRGASAHELENSLAAFRAAARMGADGVELDVHASADGTVFVHHDETLDGVHAIARTAASRVREHRLSNGEPVPTLDEVLALLGSLRVYVEVKALAPQFDERLLAALDQGPRPAGYAVHAFDHRVIRRLKQRRPNLTCGVLSASYPVRPLAALTDANATVLWQEQRLVDRELVDTVHDGGAVVFAWTVDAAERMRELIALDVDAICTNRPDVGRAVVGAAT